MNIAIDTSPLHGGHKARGVGVYTRLLSDALTAADASIRLTFVDSTVPMPSDADVVHYPYFDPFFLTLPVMKRFPTVVTVHDLIPIVYSEHFPRGVRGEIKWRIQKASLAGASRIITDSQASKNDIVRITGYPKDRIDVIYLAPAPYFQPINNAKKRSQVRSLFGLQDAFIMYVGDVNWNKNIPMLLHAFAYVVKQKGFRTLKLALVGGSFLNETLNEARQIRDLIRTLEIDNSVVMTGYVENDDLAALYTDASACVQPSVAEGFGLPVLEAMACGCPVVVSNTSSLAEIAGPATLVDPTDRLDMAEGVIRVLKSSRETLSRRAIDWARTFTWSKTALATIDTYRSILQSQL